MVTYKNPETGQTVLADESQAKFYTDKSWTPTADVSNPTFTSITSQNITPTSNITMPPQPNINSGAGVISGGNAEINALAKSTASFFVDPNTGQASTTQLPGYVTRAEYTKSNSSIEGMLKSLGVGAPPTDYSATYNTDWTAAVGEQEKAVRAKERAVTAAKQEFDTYNAQLKGIENKAKEESLILEGQNKAAGVNARVASLLNREQQEINRQAAIESLPIQALALAAQAKVMAAQGDEVNAQNVYQLAQNKFDMVFKMKMDYEDKMYQYKKDQRSALLAERTYLTQQERYRIEDLQKADDKKQEVYKTNTNKAQELQKIALNNGQADIAAQITALNPKSPNFSNDLAKLEQQINIVKEKNISDIYGTGIIGEYNFYKDAEIKAGRKPLSFNDYQTMDANRKRSINNTNITYGTQGGLTPKEFWPQATSAKNELQQGEPWGSVYKKLKLQFPKVTDETIDTALNKEFWSKPGAYQEWIKSKETGKAALTTEQLGTINDAKAAIDQVKQRYGDWSAIRSQIIEQVKKEDGFDISPYL